MKYWRCSLCYSSLPSSEAIEQHVNKYHKHERDEGVLSFTCKTLKNCFIPLVRNQIDPNFLKLYDRHIEKTEELAHGVDFTKIFIQQFIPATNEANPKLKFKRKADTNSANHQETSEQDTPAIKSKLLKKPEISKPQESYKDISKEVKLNKAKPKEKGSSSSNSKFKCRRCHKTFASWHAFLWHANNFHWKDQAVQRTCLFCGKKFKSYCEIEKHIRYHTGEHPYFCKICGKEFRRNEYRQQHEKRHGNQDRKFSCNICPRVFRRRGHLTWHLKAHANGAEKKMWKCRLCDKKCTLKSNRDAHELTHDKNRPKPFSCDICKTSYHTKRILNVHNEIHNGGELFNCHACRSVFKTARRLRNHISNVHGYIREKTVECFVCNQRFLTKQKLKEHLVLHGGGENFKATTTQTKGDDLIVKPRSQLKRYKCQVCGKGYPHKGGLEIHMYKHTGDRARPFSCDICQKRFYTEGLLKSHAEIHSRERFICEICQGSYKTSQYLRKHVLNKHGTGREKSFDCHLCSEKLYTPYLLKAHLKRHERKRPYKCDICGLTYTAPRFVIRHKRLDHDGKRKPFQADVEQPSYSTLRRWKKKNSENPSVQMSTTRKSQSSSVMANSANSRKTGRVEDS